MSIRIGIYDFFSYTLPGILYIAIFLFGLAIFNVMPIDGDLLAETSLFSLLILVTAGYFVGLLMDHIAYRWLRLLKGGNKEARKNALENFHKNHPWIKLNVDIVDWSILFQAVKKESVDIALAVEQHNATSILLRNTSLGLALLATILFLFFVAVSTNIWNLFFALLSLLFSTIALKRCETRRRWFYTGVFEAFSVMFLIDEKELGSLNMRVKKKKKIAKMSSDS